MTGRNQGIRGKNVVAKPVRTGVGARAVNPKWPAQVGASRGNRVQNSIEGGGGKVLTGVRADPYKPPNFQPVKLGNEVALNVGGGGVGTGRTLYGQSGSQGMHGKPNPGANDRPSTKGQWPDSKR